MDQSRGSNVVKIGIDLKEFYLSVEWDILDVPATRNEEYYTPQHVRDNEAAMELENSNNNKKNKRNKKGKNRNDDDDEDDDEDEEEEEEEHHSSEKLLTGKKKTCLQNAC